MKIDERVESHSRNVVGVDIVLGLDVRPRLGDSEHALQTRIDINKGHDNIRLGMKLSRRPSFGVLIINVDMNVRGRF